MKKLEENMRKLSIESLKGHLGTELVDTMIEWMPEETSLFTKKKLTEMILSIHGEKIVKEKRFRKDLLATLEPKELQAYGKELGIKVDELAVLIEKISDTSFSNNRATEYFLKLFEIDEQIMQNNHADIETIEQINTEEQFYELLDYQFYIKQRLLHFFDTADVLSRVLVHMPTGTGKTKTSMHTIVNYYTFSLEKRGLIIWIAHTTELLQQAYETFKNVWKHLGKEEVNIYRVWGDSNLNELPEEMNGIAFCGISKLQAMENSNKSAIEKLRQNCRLVVFDEAHKAAASETRKIVESFMTMDHGKKNRFLLGLTATPGRTTENSFDNTLLSNMFENRLLSIDVDVIQKMNMSQVQVQNTTIEKNIIRYFQKQHILSKIEKEQLTYAEQLTDVELTKIKTTAYSNGYTDFSKKALETIGRNKSRNFAIMRKLRELYEQRKPTIVFACSVEHGKLLSSMLSLENIPNVLVIGEMERWEREKAIRDFKDPDNPTKIIINYEVLTTGFDSTNIQCVFIARPTQSVVLYSQMLGRGLRGLKMGGNETCLLVDIKDNLRKYDAEMAFTHFENYWRV